MKKNLFNKILFILIALLIICNVYFLIMVDKIAPKNNEIPIADKQKFEVLDYNLFDGEELIFPTHQDVGQMMSCILKTKNNKIIVFDGGRKQDAKFLVDIINGYGIYEVDSWFISHIHDDHIGAICEVMNSFRDNLHIKNIYFNFAKFEWYYEKMGEDAGYVNLILYWFSEYSNYCKSNNKEVNFHDNIKGNDYFIIDDVRVNVINDIYLLDSDPINNTSIVYRADVSNKRIMVLGDIGWYGGDAILKDVNKDDLKSDIVVLSHHGQNGCGYELYEALSPQIALWPTTKYIYENVDNIYKTNETIEWMEKLNVINVLGFESNYILK